MKHTPGPWKVSEADVCGISASKFFNETIEHGFFKVQKEDSLYVHVHCTYNKINKVSKEEARLNAHLIAAAPEMLELLEKILLAHKYDGALTNGTAALCKYIENEVECLIKKAKGEM